MRAKRGEYRWDNARQTRRGGGGRKGRRESEWIVIGEAGRGEEALAATHLLKDRRADRLGADERTRRHMLLDEASDATDHAAR